MSFQTLYKASPIELKQIVIDQWKAKQNPKWHPEGNTLKHIIVVTNRAFRDFPDNKDIQLAAYFHDLGKLATYEVNPKTGQPTAYGHEDESVDLIDKFSNFIQQQGANPEIVKYIVKNHMKIKPSTWDIMKPSKKDPIMNNPHYQDLEKFGTIDKGGLLEFKYLYQNNKEMPQLINEAKRFQKLAGIITENQYNKLQESKTLYHRGSKGTQQLTVPDDLGQDIDSDDFLTALESAIDGEMSGMDYRVGEEYRLFVVDQDGDDPTKTVYFEFKQNGDKFEVDPASIKIETDESFLNEAEDISQEIQALVDKNEFLKGKVKATPADIIEGSKFVLLFSEDAAKHIAERHLDGSKPGSLFKGVNLRDVAKKLLNTTPSEEAGGRVKWLGVNGGNVGEMGVAKASPEEVAKMKDYTMPDGQKEQVKIAPGKRKPTSEVSLITAELGTLNNGKKALSMITMFPGGTKVDGTEIPMNRGEFAAKGLYFVVDPSSSLLKEIDKIVNEALAKFRKTGK